jgi:hypothetical protein
MSKFRVPEQKEMEMVQHAFAELETVDTLLHMPPKSEADRITASDLHDYACGDVSVAKRTKSALMRFPAMRGILKDMVAKASDYQMPEAIAASTDEFPQRRTEGCKVRMEASRAEADHHYLIIELDEGRKIPSVLTLCDVEGKFEQLALPPPRRGVIQVTVTNNSGIPDMLRNPKTAIYLR